MSSVYIFEVFERLFPQYKGGEMEDYGHHTIKVQSDNKTFIFEYHGENAWYLQVFPANKEDV